MYPLHNIRDAGHLRIFPEFRIIFFYLRGKKKTWARQVDYFFVWEKLAV